MERIASFSVDHDKLEPGIYVSRIDGDIVTYDIRMRKPNCPPFLENSVMHSLEHLFATEARNGKYAGQVIYFGPMGCRTGFYFLVRGLAQEEALAYMKEIMRKVSKFEGTLPGNTAPECGNYLEHDMEGAKREAALFLPVIEGWTVQNMRYTK